MPNDRGWSDNQVDTLLGRLLQTGVVIATVIVLGGLSIFLYRHGSETPRFTHFTGEPERLRSIKGIARSVFRLEGRGMIQLGLLTLVATPVARVAFSLYAFARQHDRTYVLITLVVLTVLVLSLFGVL